jgi:hypothetical protein
MVVRSTANQGRKSMNFSEKLVPVLSLAVTAVVFFATGANAQTKTFKAGDRVMTSPSGLSGDKYYQPCTVTSVSTVPSGYYVRCDPWNGSTTWMDFYVRPDYVRAWPNATAAPVSPTCSFEPPAAAVSRSSVASQAVFSRVIYDWFALAIDGGVTAPLKVGIAFKSFEIAPSYKNTIVNDSGTGAHLRDDGAPPSATIYPVKATYIHCRAYRNSIEREVVQADFACFKDKFGDWTCPNDGATKVLERSSTPIEK